jgi:hypothetical protein
MRLAWSPLTAFRWYLKLPDFEPCPVLSDDSRHSLARPTDQSIPSLPNHASFHERQDKKSTVILFAGESRTVILRGSDLRVSKSAFDHPLLLLVEVQVTIPARIRIARIYFGFFPSRIT